MAITVLLTWYCRQLGLVDAILSSSAGYLSLWVPHLLRLPKDKRGRWLFFHTTIQSLISRLEHEGYDTLARKSHFVAIAVPVKKSWLHSMEENKILEYFISINDSLDCSMLIRMFSAFNCQ